MAKREEQVEEEQVEEMEAVRRVVLVRPVQTVARVVQDYSSIVLR
jgi:hypothetical protein